MGLDSYLYKKTYVKQWDHDAAKDQWTVSIINGEGKTHPSIQPTRVAYVQEQIGYWRKFNALHQWFVSHCADGVDNCQPVYVPREQLAKLLDTLKRVWNAQDTVIVDEVAADLLPSQSGFFFGSTDYDAWYFDDVRRTIDLLEEELINRNEDQGYQGSYYYEASW